jgi:hypothetical protein
MLTVIAVTNGDLLSHPLVLLILGGAFTGYLLPRLTRKWQDRQKELEVKIELVSQISEVAVPAWGRLVSGIEPLGTKDTVVRDELMQAYRDWEIESTKILSTLSAYYRDGYVPQKWLIYCEIVRVAFNLTWTDAIATREALVQTLKKDVSWLSNEDPVQPQLSLGAMNTLEEGGDVIIRGKRRSWLTPARRRGPEQAYFGKTWMGVDDDYWSGIVNRKTWFHFRQSILSAKNGMVQLILDSPIF